ncbi:MAG: Flp family type IVb pilin [Burkholderiaceae bacterium]
MKSFIKANNFFTAPRDEEEGASMVEYGLLGGLIAIVVIGALTLLGGGISDLFNEAEQALPEPAVTTPTTAAP